MGASLYIPSLHEAYLRETEQQFVREIKALHDFEEVLDAHERWSSADPGHFRDAYNAMSILWFFGLSWWDVVPPNCDLDAAHLLSLIDRPITRGAVEAYCLANNLDIGQRVPITADRDLKGEQKAMKALRDPGQKAILIKTKWRGEVLDSTVKWVEFFQAKRDRLRTFLKRSIELREPVRASL
jgi:hypothetical protein